MSVLLMSLMLSPCISIVHSYFITKCLNETWPCSFVKSLILQINTSGAANENSEFDLF